MQNIEIILKAPDLPIEQHYICYEEFPIIEYFYICTESPLKLREQSAYIGTSDQIEKLITSETVFYPILYIVTDCPEEFWNKIQCYSCNLLFIKWKAHDIFNKLNDILNSYRHWLHTFELMALQKTSLQSLIDVGSAMLNCPVFLINTGYSLVACHLEGEVDFPGVKELLNKGFLSIEHLLSLGENPNVTFIPIRQGVSVISFLLIAQGNQDYMAKYLTALLLNAIKSHLPAPAPESALYYRVEFEQLVYDLIERNVSTKEEVDQRFQLLNLRLKPHFCCMVIEHKKEIKSPLPLNPMIPTLQKLFAGGHFCIYNRTIVALIPVQHYVLPSYDEQEFQNLLNHWQSYAGFSSPASHLEQFRSFYIMASKAIHFGSILGNGANASLPIFSYEDFRIYHIIDMCKDGFQHNYHHDNLIYLCHPLIIRLYSYDQKNQSDYLKILSTYLKLNCNLAQTARELSYHRNTMINKINKIESLIETSLNNTELQQAFLFSCMIIRYISEYLKKDLFSLRIAAKNEL